MNENHLVMWVPNGHPFEGQSITLYPDNGATTYTDGTVEFRSQQSEAMRGLRESLAELRTALQEMKHEPSC